MPTDLSLDSDPIASAELAAKRLRDGHTVDWQPGDGTRYECHLLHSYVTGRDHMAVLNLGLVVWLRASMHVHLWVRDPLGGKSHPGLWMGLRPLLAALGYAAGGAELRPSDAQEELDERAAQHTNQPIDRDDAELGKLVRLTVEAQRGLTSVR